MARTVVLFLVAFAVAAIVAQIRFHAGAPPVSEIAASWSGSRSDAGFAAWLEARRQKLDAEVATVVTDARLRARLIAYVGATVLESEHAREEFLDEKRRDHGLAPGTPLAYDGVSWVVTKD